jgi:predicted transcriptional regulator
LDEDMSRRKLTVEQVLEARLRYRAGERELSKLAREFGVTRQALQSAVVGHTFKDLPMPPKSLR